MIVPVLPTSDYLYEQGSDECAIYVVKHGKIKVSRQIEGTGDDEDYAVFGPGSCFGEVESLLKIWSSVGPRRQSSVVAALPPHRRTQQHLGRQ